MPAIETAPPTPRERVLPTLNEDGSRRWIRPKPSKGAFHKRRLVTAWGLIALFTAIPYLRMNGKPMMLLDLPHRQFTLFGTTFLPTDTMFLMLLLVGIFVGIFLLTAILGRVWCGWACPQTVYMEFLFRPLERLIEGNRARQIKLDREGPDARRVLKSLVFAVVSMFLAHTFLAYFVGIGTLARWMTGSPSQHWAAFLVMAVTTGLMFLDFGYFREQVCLVACPYGRFQSVLLDRQSLIVGYDTRRGEPRALVRNRKGGAAPHGDCIACDACVQTCPTGIDIREGLQMECVHCTQCIDACDAVMDKIGKPRGLIRYTSRDELDGKPRRLLRPRVAIYPAILLLVWGFLGYALAHRTSADVTVLRGIGSPFAILPDGQISNQLRIKIVNRSDGDRAYRLSLEGAPELELVVPENPMSVARGKTGTAAAFVIGPPSAIPGGQRDITVRVTDGAGYDGKIPYRVLGPERED